MREQKAIVREFFDQVVYRTPYAERYVRRTTINAYDILTRKDAVLDMLDRLELRRGKLLDVGCGPAVFTPQLVARGFDVWGVDIAPAVIQQARDLMDRAGHGARCHFSVGDVERLDFPDDAFDAIIAIGLFEYLRADAPALKEFARVLKPGGVAVISLQHRFSWHTTARSVVWPLRPLFRTAFGRRANPRELCGRHVTRTYSGASFAKIGAPFRLEPVIVDHINFNAIPFNLPGSLPAVYWRLMDRVNHSRSLRRRVPWLYGSVLVALRKRRARRG